MNEVYSVAELVPHSGKMSLLDRITGYDEDWLCAEVDIRSDSMFADKNGVPSWVGMEYMAQTIGAFSGLQERLSGEAPKLGFLLGSRKYSCNKDCFPIGRTLTLRVEREMQGENGLSAFKCTLESDEIEAEANLNVFQPSDADKFLQEVTT